MNIVLKFFADLRLTVVLLGLSILMIFFGTLDQTNIGIKGTLEKYFEGTFTTWQYPEEWPLGTRMVLALPRDDPNAKGSKLDLSQLKDSGYKFVGYNDNTFYEQAHKVYRQSELEGPDLKFSDLAAIKAALKQGEKSLKRAAVLPMSSLQDDLEKGTLATATIKGVPPNTLRWIRVPIVGGYILGPLLFINLLCAHFARFKLSWKKTGVFIIHGGLIIMLVSELVTDLTDRESIMVIEEGETATYSTDFDKNELVLLDRSRSKVDTVLSVPVEWIEKGGSLDVSTLHADFPFTIDTEKFFHNTEMEIPVVPNEDPVLGAARTEAADQASTAESVVKAAKDAAIAEGLTEEDAITEAANAASRAVAEKEFEASGDATLAGEKARHAALVAGVDEADAGWIAGNEAAKLDGYSLQIGDRSMRVTAKEVEETADPQQINFVSALVRVRVGNKTYGPFFVSNRFGFFEDYRKHTFVHGGREYAIALRRTRYNYDFGVRLDDFRFLRYPGTETPKDFTSDVTLRKPDTTEEEKRIYMNHPLIYDGNTFFQSGWNEKTEKGTQLQVVQNPGKSLPYIGVVVVGLGLMVQFSMHLGRFTKRRSRLQKKEEVA